MPISAAALKMRTPVWDPPTPPAKAMRLQAEAPNSAPPRLDFTEQPEDKPHAIVGADEHGVKWFTLVLVDKHQKPGRKVSMRPLHVSIHCHTCSTERSMSPPQMLK